jgi:hypothetical protein
MPRIKPVTTDVLAQYVDLLLDEETMPIVTDEYDDLTFNVSEVGKVFFGRSAHWVRWVEREKWTSIGGHAIGHRAPGNARTYTLADVEQMARLLWVNERINDAQLARTLMIVRLLVQLHDPEKSLEAEDLEEDEDLEVEG